MVVPRGRRGAWPARPVLDSEGALERALRESHGCQSFKKQGTTASTMPIATNRKALAMK